jgi:hypothetical protein
MPGHADWFVFADEPGLIPRWDLLLAEVRKQHKPKTQSRHAMTPFNIRLMLHFRCSCGPLPDEAARTSNAYVQGVRFLLRQGMIERPTRDQQERHPGWAYRATAKGICYVDHLTTLPLPVSTEQWTMPRA